MLFQLSSNSSWWSCAHSTTRLNTFDGNLPSITPKVVIDMAALYSLYSAWKWGGLCSLKYMYIMIPRNLLNSGINDHAINKNLFVYVQPWLKRDHTNHIYHLLDAMQYVHANCTLLMLLTALASSLRCVFAVVAWDFLFAFLQCCFAVQLAKNFWPWSSFSPHSHQFPVWPDRRIYRTDGGASKPSRSRRCFVYSGAVSKTDSVFHPIGLNDDQGRIFPRVKQLNAKSSALWVVALNWLLFLYSILKRHSQRNEDLH